DRLAGDAGDPCEAVVNLDAVGVFEVGEVAFGRGRVQLVPFGGVGVPLDGAVPDRVPPLDGDRLADLDVVDFRHWDRLLGLRRECRPGTAQRLSRSSWTIRRPVQN